MSAGMTRDEFEALAKKAGLAKHGLGWTAWESQLERFAELVAAHERANARLMAAAPCLRQALLHAIECHPELGTDPVVRRARDSAVAD